MIVGAKEHTALTVTTSPVLTDIIQVSMSLCCEQVLNLLAISLWRAEKLDCMYDIVVQLTYISHYNFMSNQFLII